MINDIEQAHGIGLKLRKLIKTLKQSAPMTMTEIEIAKATNWTERETHLLVECAMSAELILEKDLGFRCYTIREEFFTEGLENED